MATKAKKPVKKVVAKTKKSSKELATKVTITESKLTESKPRISIKLSRKKLYIFGGVVLGVLLLLFIAGKFLVVAWVDNKPLTWFEYYNTLNSRYGNDTKDQLISQKLIFDEANNRHITVSTQEVDAQINTIKAQSQGDANFNQLLAQQGLTLDELKRQIKLQVMIKKMFQPGITVTDDEINKYIADNKAQYPDVTDTVKTTVKDQLVQQKLIDVFRTWLQNAQKSNRVVKT